MRVCSQLNYQRGINNFVQMVEHWSALAFIRDINAGHAGYPYFTETERNNELFTYFPLPVSEISRNPEDSETTIPVFYIADNPVDVKKRGKRGALMANFLEKRAFKKIKVGPNGLQRHRSGTHSRR